MKKAFFHLQDIPQIDLNASKKKKNSKTNYRDWSTTSIFKLFGKLKCGERIWLFQKEEYQTSCFNSELIGLLFLLFIIFIVYWLLLLLLFF